MNFGRFDVMMLFCLVFAVLIMSLTFPALGMADGGSAEFPEYELNAERFDFAGDFPDNPGTPARGSVEYRASLGQESDNVRFLAGDTSNGARINATPESDVPSIRLDVFDSGSEIGNQTVSSTTEGSVHQVTESGWIVRFTFDEITNTNTTESPEWDYQVSYQVVDRPSDSSGWLTSIPLVGGIFDAGDSVAQAVIWIGSVGWWFVTTMWTIALNAIGMLYDTVAFAVELLTWLTATYSSVVQGANGWVSAFVALPGLLLSLLFAKLVFVGVSLLPTT